MYSPLNPVVDNYLHSNQFILPQIEIGILIGNKQLQTTAGKSEP